MPVVGRSCSVAAPGTGSVLELPHQRAAEAVASSLLIVPVEFVERYRPLV